jgi:hypothetical protein
MTTGQEGGQAYVKEIMRREVEEAQAAAAARARPAARARRGRTVALALAPLVVLLSGWNVYRLTHRAAAATTAEELATGRFAIYLVASGVDAFRAERGALPADLAAIGAEDEGVEYARTETGYQLRAAVGDSVFTYRSGESLEPFRGSYTSLQRRSPP